MYSWDFYLLHPPSMAYRYECQWIHTTLHIQQVRVIQWYIVYNTNCSIYIITNYIINPEDKIKSSNELSISDQTTYSLSIHFQSRIIAALNHTYNFLICTYMLISLVWLHFNFSFVVDRNIFLSRFSILQW